MTNRTTSKLTTFVAILILTLLSTAMINCGGKQSLSHMSARELFEYGKEKYDAGKYFRATEIFQTIIYDYPGETLVDTAQYYLAMSYYANDDHILGRVEFNRLINYYPSSVFVAHSVFMKAVCLFEGAPKHHGLDQSQVKESITEFEDFLIDFPESDFIPQVHAYLDQARSRIAQKDYDAAIVYFRMHAYKAAKIYFQLIIDNYTTTSLGGNSLYYIAKMDLENGMYDDARRGFDSFLSLHPEHKFVRKAKELRSEAAFEAARVPYKNGDLTAARAALGKFVADYPDSKQVDDAHELLGNIPAVTAESDSLPTASDDQES